MKKVLILAYDFPPYVSVGGLRPYNWYRYLKEFDAEPVVITRQWENKHGNQLDYIDSGSSSETIVEKTAYGTIIRTPYQPNFANRLMLKYGEKKYRILRKSISAFYEFAQFILPIGPKAELYRGAKHYLKNNEVDVIIATGDPFVLFSFASKLSKEFGIPWIADYRDPWSQSFSAKKGIIQRKIDYFFEKKYVRTANSLITVDILFKLKLAQFFPTKQINILPNGFDPIEIDKTKNIEQNNSLLTFAFIGTIYLWHPLNRLLESFSNFVKENPQSQILIKFYGINDMEFIEEKSKKLFPELLDKLIFLSKIPNGDLLQRVSKDNVLLLFNYYQFTGTKIYDYLGLKRRILLCFENDREANKLKEQYYFKTIETDICPQIDIINETNSGVIVEDAAHLKEVLKELYKEFEEKGFIACDSIGVEKYSRKIQVEKLAELVRHLDKLDDRAQRPRAQGNPAR
jgi:hypothetical protein